MNCDLCGKEAELYLTEVEGTRLSVCHGCSKYGEVIKKIILESPKEKKKKQARLVRLPEKEIIQLVVPNYAGMIRNKREKLGLKQKDLAKNISEKESRMSKIESGVMEPSINLARKLEKFLKVKLVEEHEVVPEAKKAAKTEAVTIGDIIKFKKKE